MADEKPHLLTFPSRYTDLQQSEQILEELPVQLHLLPLWRIARIQFRSPSLSCCCLSDGCGFLFGDRRPYTIEKGEDECQVDGSGDTSSVLEIEVCKLGDESFDGSIRGQQPQLRLCCHRCCCRGTACCWTVERTWG